MADSIQAQFHRACTSSVSHARELRTKQFQEVLDKVNATLITEDMKETTSGGIHCPSNLRYIAAACDLELGQLCEQSSPPNYERAKQYYLHSVKVFPNNVEAYLYLAIIAYTHATSQQDFEDYVSYLNLAIQAGKQVELELRDAKTVIKKTSWSMLSLATSSITNEVKEEAPEPAFVMTAAEARQVKVIIQSEQSALCRAKSKLCLFRLQQGEPEQAQAMLVELGFKYRLSDAVLHYNPNDAKGGETDADVGEFVRSVDGVFPRHLLAHMQDFLSPQSKFWRECRYGPHSSYFSYMHPLSLEEPRYSLDQIIRHVQGVAAKLMPAVANATYAEWWTHMRPHSHGHQLHFDSDDEGMRRGRESRVHNPIASTVMYLTGSDSDQPFGGPTLVTDQSLDSPGLAKRGWLAFPKENRMTIFRGNVLHGVIPGRGFPPPSTDPSRKRITFMIAFWDDLVEGEKREDGLGSCQRIEKVQQTWPELVQPRAEWGFKGPSSEHIAAMKELSLKTLRDVWVPIAKKDDNNAQVKKRRLEKPSYDDCFQGW